METITTALRNSYELAWGIPFLFILSLAHIILTIRTRFIQRKLFQGIKLSFKTDKLNDSSLSLKGELSNYRIFSVLMCGTLGTGNILGMATAIYIGGAGAVFWCVVVGIFAMASSYMETYLSLKFRRTTPDGRILAGPMYVIEEGFGFKWLAYIFAMLTIIASLGIGAIVPINALLEFSTQNIVFGQLPGYLLSLFIALLSAIFIFGGLKSVSNMAIFLTPAILITFFFLAISLLIINFDYLFLAIKLIIKSAFSYDATLGGIAGGGLMVALKVGVSKGVFSNEALIGSTPIVSGTAITKNNHRQALISQSVIFWDTAVICFITGVIIVSSLLKNQASPEPTTLINPIDAVLFSFHQIPYVGKIFLYLLVFFLTFSTVLIWSYYGERCAEYLFGGKIIIPYKLFFLIIICLTPTLDKGVIWQLSDILIVIMAFPNILAVLFLSGIAIKESKKYINDIEAYDPANIKPTKKD